MSTRGANALNLNPPPLENAPLDHKKIRAEVDTLAVGEGLSRAAVAKQASIPSPSTLSEFLNGNYKGDNEKIARLLAAWLKQKKEGIELAPGEFRHTSITKKIFTAMRTVHITGGVGLVYGDPGVGKSAAIRSYIEANPATILVTASPALNSPRPLLAQLAEAVGKAALGSLVDIMTNLTSALEGSDRLIVIDESQHTTYQTLECLRSLVDQCGVRLILSGNNTVFDRMTLKKGIPYEQMQSRIVVKVDLDASKITRDDVAVVSRPYLNGSFEECVDWLYERIGKIGHLRLIVNHCKLAKVVSGGKPISVDDLKKVDLMLGDIK